METAGVLRQNGVSKKRSEASDDVKDRIGFAAILVLQILCTFFFLQEILANLLGLTIALIGLQMVLGRRHLWLPDWLMRRQMQGARVRPAMARMTGIARWIDRHSRDRLGVLTAVTRFAASSTKSWKPSGPGTKPRKPPSTAPNSAATPCCAVSKRRTDGL